MLKFDSQMISAGCESNMMGGAAGAQGESEMIDVQLTANNEV